MGASDRGWLEVDEACRYLGLDPWDETSEDILEEEVVRHGVDAVYDDDANLLEIDPDGLSRALFARHEAELGYRPDDDDIQEAFKQLHEENEEADRQHRQSQGKRLRRRVLSRVKARGEAL